MAKAEEREKARLLRQNGYSIKQIAKEVGVSTSTVGKWCGDIDLTEIQIKELERRAKDPYYSKRWMYILKRKAEKNRKVEEIKAKAKTDLGLLRKKEKLIAGAALYWAEGFKKDRMVGFANTDPIMIQFIIGWLRDCLEVKNEDIRLRVGINESHKYRTEEIMDYWEEITGIRKENFYKPYFQKVAWQKRYDHPERYFGTLRIRVLKSTDLLRRIMGLIEGIG